MAGQCSSRSLKGGRVVFYFLSSTGWSSLPPTSRRGGGGSSTSYHQQGGGASAQKIQLTECSTCEVCLAALPFPSWEEGSGRLGGHRVKGQFVKGADEELKSSVWRGSEAVEEETRFTRGLQAPEGLYFLKSFFEIDC